MSSYFDEVERALRAAVRCGAHLPWHRRMWRRHRGAVALVTVVMAVGPTLAAAGVFKSDLQIRSSTCSARGGSASSDPVASCTFALSDGTRFACPQAFALSHPTASDIVRAKSCAALRRSPDTVPSVALAIARARNCLTTRGLSARGGPAPSAAAGAARRPEGELIVGNATTRAIAAFYSDALTAKRAERTVVRNARRFGGQVERRGAVTIVWIRSPSSDRRAALRRCVYR